MKSEELRLLLDKLDQGKLTEEENQKLNNFEAMLDNEPDLTESLSEKEKGVLKQRMWEAVRHATLPGYAPVIEMYPAKGKRIWFRTIAAAIIVMMLGVGSYFAFFNKEKPTIATTPNPLENDIPPGKEGAILTLADGRQIVLDDARNGSLARQGNSELIKENGQVSIKENNDNSVSDVVYNTMSTAKGRQYSLVLADGSKVWLNAASSIRFPTAFRANERKVEITGEAYFEVTHDATKPFYVMVNGMQVQVLGTHFNVNAYGNESIIKTTLLEGSVKVFHQGKSSMLRPGQQSQLDLQNSKIEVINNADVELALAWKNGFTSFKRADIKTIMRQVERWYDVEVIYDGTIPMRTFSGDISRSANLSELLRLLKANNINFRLEGRKLTITP